MLADPPGLTHNVSLEEAWFAQGQGIFASTMDPNSSSKIAIKMASPILFAVILLEIWISLLAQKDAVLSIPANENQIINQKIAIALEGGTI